MTDDVVVAGAPEPQPPCCWPGPGPSSIAPRRTVLDPILLTAAEQAGAKVEMGVSVHGLLRESGRVTGVLTSAGPRRGRLVIGADGRNSRIARLAGASTYHDHPPVTFAYYTYWRGCSVAGVHLWLEPRRFIGVFPVGDGLTLAFVQAPRGEYPTFRRDPFTAYLRELRSRPALAGLLGEAVTAEQLRGHHRRLAQQPGGGTQPVRASTRPVRYPASVTRAWVSPGWTWRPARWARRGSG